MEVDYLNSSKEVIARLCDLVGEKAKESIAARGSFKVGFSGGSLVNFLAEGLPRVDSEWDKWVVFFCDERVVPFDDQESTFGAYKDKLVGKVPLKVDNFVTINPQMKAEDAAEDYRAKMRQHFPDGVWPQFDLLLLGMGPDGHTCSLFPNHPLLREDRVWVAPINDSPKPPSSRITLTLPVLNHSRACVFPITGKEKAAIFKRILDNPEEFPAGMVRPVNGLVHWILDTKLDTET